MYGTPVSKSRPTIGGLLLLDIGLLACWPSAWHSHWLRACTCKKPDGHTISLPPHIEFSILILREALQT